LRSFATLKEESEIRSNGMEFNMTENGLNEALLGLYKPIAEVTRDTLAVSGTPSDIGTAPARVTLAFDHHSLRTSVYHSCRARARMYVESSSNYQDIVLQKANSLLCP